MFNFGDEKALIKHNGYDYSAQEVKKLILPRIAWLNMQKCNNLILTGEDNFEFVLNFFAGIFAEKEIFLVADKTKIETFGDDFIKNIELADCKNLELRTPDAKNVFINLFTSGSTGEPKLIRKTLQNLLNEAEDLIKQFPIPKDCVFLTTAKMSHMFGIVFALIFPLANGNLIDTNMIKFPEQIKSDNFVFITTPSFLDKMAKYDNNPRKPKYIFTAGDKLNNSAFEYFEKDSNVVEIYGSTESGTVAFRTSSKDSFLTPLKNVKVRADINNQIVVESHYFLENHLTLNDIIEKSGNKFRILGRSDRILKVQEKRISAVELENILNKHEFIENSYCLKTGEKVGAAIVLTGKGREKLLETGSAELIKLIKAYVKKSSEIVPQKWRFLYEIPKNSAGKTDKTKIENIFGLNLSMPFVIDKKITGNGAEIKLIFLKNSNFFKGHFPDVAILPGVVQLFFAHFLAEDVFDEKISMKKIKKIKFSRVIKPEREVILKLKNSELSVDFIFKDSENQFSSGTFIK